MLRRLGAFFLYIYKRTSILIPAILAMSEEVSISFTEEKIFRSLSFARVMDVGQ